MDTIPLVDLGLQHQQVAAEVMAGMQRVFDATDFILGEEVRLFEQEFAAFCDVKHCIGVGSGTDALELTLRARDLVPGDEIILPANTFVATAMAVIRVGATPVLVDCDPEQYLIDVNSVYDKLTARTRVIIPVHLYGHMAPMEPIKRLAAERGLVVIEDAAQSHGASQNGVKAGGSGLAAGTSFHPAKNLGAYGDAGAVLTNSSAIDQRVRRLRNYGSGTKYEHVEVGFNSRLDSLQAVVLRAKLKRLAAWNRERLEAADRYHELLSDLDCVKLPKPLPGNDHAFHLYVIQIDDRDTVAARLRDRGIQVGIHYPVPLHLQPVFRGLGGRAGNFPVAEAVARRALSLPLFPGIYPHQQERVVGELREAMGRP